jgi:hypothetical protein
MQLHLMNYEYEKIFIADRLIIRNSFFDAPDRQRVRAIVFVVRDHIVSVEEQVVYVAG